MPIVDLVANRLADEVSADRPAAELVSLQQLAHPAAIAIVGYRAIYLEVVTPAGELEAVEPPPAAVGAQVGYRAIGPLAGEQRDRTPIR